jgi:MarR family transcriptional regulator, organic hydroperoxide resistance regulator
MPRTATIATPPVADAATWLQLDRQLCFALYSSSLAMTRLYKPLLEPLGLTYPQYLVLLVLWEQDELTVSAVGDKLFLDSGTLTPLLKRMEAAGWLSRQRSAQDERQVLVRLTDTGRALREQACPLPPRLLTATGCAAAELQDLTNTLQALRGRLRAAVDAGTCSPTADEQPASTALPINP